MRYSIIGANLCVRPTAKIHTKYLNNSELTYLYYSSLNTMQMNRNESKDGAAWNIFAIDNEGSKINAILVDSLLYKNTIYKKVVKDRNKPFYFVPNIGLVRWINQSERDTFNLIKYNIQ